MTAQPAAAITPGESTDITPDSLSSGVLFGGRVQALAVDPGNDKVVYAATELGGLWRTGNGGASWAHVNAVPIHDAWDVQFAPSDASLIIATGAYDGSIDNRGGGIWRSTNGGRTWAKAPDSNNSLCASSAYAYGYDNQDGSAFNIAIGPGTTGKLPVFVATGCGLAKSTDSGSSWSYDDPDSSGSSQFWDVKIEGVKSKKLVVDACGADGFFRSYDGGSTWPVQNAAAMPSGTWGPCSIAAAPGDYKTVFLASANSVTEADMISGAQLLENDDNGTGSWRNLNVSNDGNGRPPFVDAFPAFSADAGHGHFEVFYGTDQDVVHQTCSTEQTPMCSAGSNAATDGGHSSGSWSLYDKSVLDVHNGSDPSGLVLDPATGCPFLESGDGGVFATTNGCTSSPTFTASNVGLHALWLYSFSGTTTDAVSTNLVFGTQDNGWFASTNNGATWSNGGPDVFQTIADMQDPVGTNPSVLWDGDGGYTLSPETNLHSSESWSLPTNLASSGSFTTYPIAQFGTESYAIITPDCNTETMLCEEPLAYEVQVTTNDGATWTQMGPTLPGPPVGLPNGAQPIAAQFEFGPPSGNTSADLYMELSVGGEPTIYNLSGHLDGSATLRSRDADLVWPGVFGVNPNDPMVLYAVDDGYGSGEVMYTHDGGKQWQPDTVLTGLVTDNGLYPFDTTAGNQVTAFGFDPNGPLLNFNPSGTDDSTVLVGTVSNGVFASGDGGAHWISVPGTGAIWSPTGFFFDYWNNGIVYAGSEGRGAWEIDLPSADLSLSDVPSSPLISAGGDVTYTLTATNSASSASAAGKVVVSVTLPPQETYVSSSTACTVQTPTVLTCGLSDLAPGQTGTLTLTARASTGILPFVLSSRATVESGDVIDDNQGNNTATATLTGYQWIRATPLSGEVAKFLDVSCATGGLCAAGAGPQILEGDPIGFGAHSSWRVVATDPDGTITAMSCPKVTFCMATDSADHVLVSNDPGAPGTWKNLDVLRPLGNEKLNGPITSVSCSAQLFCAIGTGAGFVFESRTPTRVGTYARSYVTPSRHGSAIDGLSCEELPTSMTGCLAVTENGDAVESVSSGVHGPWYASTIDGTRSIGVVSCFSGQLQTLCAAGDADGILTSVDPFTPKAAWRRSLTDRGPTGPETITALSCPPPNGCVALDGAGRSLVNLDPSADSSRWLVQQVESATGVPVGVWCGGGPACVAVDSAGDTFTWASDAMTKGVPAPEVVAISPSTGDVAGGTLVTIRGTSLLGAKVLFGRQQGVLRSDTGSTLTVLSPRGRTGGIDVTVITPGGTARRPDGFLYDSGPLIRSMTPSFAPTRGGTAFRLGGFRLAHATVSIVAWPFDHTLPVAVHSDTATLITGVLPRGPGGLAFLTVTTPDGASNEVSFVYLAPPTLSLATSMQEGHAGVALTLTARVAEGIPDPTGALAPVVDEGPNPTGQVYFSVDGAAAHCSTGSDAAQLHGGVAACRWTPTKAGQYRITFAYSGDADYAATGPSPTLVQDVGAAGSTSHGQVGRPATASRVTRRGTT